MIFHRDSNTKYPDILVDQVTGSFLNLNTMFKKYMI